MVFHLSDGNSSFKFCLVPWKERTGKERGGEDKQQILPKVFRNSAYGSPNCDHEMPDFFFFKLGFV